MCYLHFVLSVRLQSDEGAAGQWRLKTGTPLLRPNLSDPNNRSHTRSYLRVYHAVTDGQRDVELAIPPLDLRLLLVRPAPLTVLRQARRDIRVTRSISGEVDWLLWRCDTDMTDTFNRRKSTALRHGLHLYH